MTYSQAAFSRQSRKYYAFYTGGFVAFVVLLACGERLGMTPKLIGYIFMFATIGLYAGIGIMSRTADVSEYYVAGRRVPAVFNGMATAADWMSAASFIGLAGTLYISGYQGLAFVMGWTGGYVLVALLLAPYLRKFGQFTIPDFLGARYGGNLARAVGVFGAILASFAYVVAQNYGVGIITSRFIGMSLEIGVFVGLAGVLVCSFLGGMRAVTWTQVAQYVVLIVAYMVPVTMISLKLTGVPLPQAVYGQVLHALGEREKQLFDDPGEIDARAKFKEKADRLDAKIAALPGSLEIERKTLARRVDVLRAENASAREVAAVEHALAAAPATSVAARDAWTKARDSDRISATRPHAHAAAHPGAGHNESDSARRNFIGL